MPCLLAGYARRSEISPLILTTAGTQNHALHNNVRVQSFSIKDGHFSSKATSES